MSAGRYVTMSVKNTEAASVAVVVKDPDGNEHTINVLTPGTEVILLAPTDATWSFKFITGSANGDMLAPLDPTGSKGKGQGITSG
jgi:hypothetical protein